MDAPPRVLYTNAQVPVEWIVAHRLEPLWYPGFDAPQRTSPATDTLASGRGVCAFAESIGRTVRGLSPDDASAVVLTTACDQMRWTADRLMGSPANEMPIFLMHLPRTWKTETARAMHIGELQRLGRFFETIGGTSPSDAFLREVMLRYERFRRDVASTRERSSSVHFASQLDRCRGPLGANDSAGEPDRVKSPRGPRLALVGGPVSYRLRGLLRRIEASGGRVALDATSLGERTLPEAFVPDRCRENPRAELARAYFDGIPEIHHRPNDRFYRWLREWVERRRIEAILLVRFVGCDLWHAELGRLRESFDLPVVDLDFQAAESETALAAGDRTVTRLESLLEMLE